MSQSTTKPTTKKAPAKKPAAKKASAKKASATTAPAKKSATKTASKPELKTAGSPLREISISELHESPSNPRQHFEESAMAELKSSIESIGIIEDPVVRPRPEAQGEGGYEIVAGSRRIRCARELGWLSVGVKVRNLSDAEVLEMQLSENLSRSELNPMEEARGLRAYGTASGLGPAAIGRKFGHAAAWVQLRFDLLELPAEAQEALAQRELSLGAAEQLCRVNPEEREEATQLVLHPAFSQEPMTEATAKKTLEERYLVPRQKRLKWAKRTLALQLKPNEEVLEDILGAARYVNAWGTCHPWLDASEPLGRSALREQDGAILWKALAEQHGAKLIVVPELGDPDGKLLRLVDVQSLRQLEEALAEAGEEHTLQTDVDLKIERALAVVRIKGDGLAETLSTSHWFRGQEAETFQRVLQQRGWIGEDGKPTAKFPAGPAGPVSSTEEEDAAESDRTASEPDPEAALKARNEELRRAGLPVEPEVLPDPPAPGEASLISIHFRVDDKGGLWALESLPPIGSGSWTTKRVARSMPGEYDRNRMDQAYGIAQDLEDWVGEEFERRFPWPKDEKGEQPAEA